MTVRDKTGTSGRGTPRVPPPPVSDEDWKVKVSGADTTPGFLNVKIPSTANLSWTIGTPGGNEQWLGSVVGITEPSGPTVLPFGAIPAGSVLARVGGFVVGVNVAGGGFFWGAGNVATTAVTRFLQPGYQTGVAPTTGVRIPIRRPGTLRNLTMQNRVVGVGAALITFTLLKNGVATALSFSVAATAASGSDIVDTVSVVAGDFIELRVTKAAAIATSPTDVEVAVDFGP